MLKIRVELLWRVCKKDEKLRKFASYSFSFSGEVLVLAQEKSTGTNMGRGSHIINGLMRLLYLPKSS